LARPFRYTFILALFAAGTTLAAVGGWRYARASAPVNGPVLLVSIGTLRADHLPVYGYRKVKTPAIDALGADGVVFERAYSHAPQTLPAHASLLSGRLPFETGVRDNVGFVVKDAERMLPEMLSDRGFATGAVLSSYALR
jgi:arylsulfatase A-like enzyme